MFIVKYPIFLNFCKFISDPDLLDYVESLAIGQTDSKKYLPLCDETPEIFLSKISNNRTDKILNNDQKRTIKDITIEIFFLKVQQEQNLTTKETKQILRNTCLKHFLKVVSTKNVTFEDGQISSIDSWKINKMEKSKT
jgi:hypothetical protein